MTAFIQFLWQPLAVLAGMAIWALLLWVVVATIADRVKARVKRRVRP